MRDTGKISDGYHTFDELYEHRHALYIALCRKIVSADKQEAQDGFKMEPFRVPRPMTRVWRSKQHHDGSWFDGWFALGIGVLPGKQITYHLPDRLWDECAFAETHEKAPCEFDGHTPADVIKRLKKLS